METYWVLLSTNQNRVSVVENGMFEVVGKERKKSGNCIDFSMEFFKTLRLNDD